MAEGLSLITFRTLARAPRLTCRRENVVVSSRVSMGICPSCPVEQVARSMGFNLIGYYSLTNFESTSVIGAMGCREIKGRRCEGPLVLSHRKLMFAAATSSLARPLCYLISQLILDTFCLHL